jgi:hypothetical protein
MTGVDIIRCHRASLRGQDANLEGISLINTILVSALLKANQHSGIVFGERSRF